VNQVWSTDITYIRLHGGFIYLVAVMDWFSRYLMCDFFCHQDVTKPSKSNG
jgi:transposase InsO family protein